MLYDIYKKISITDNTRDKIITGKDFAHNAFV